MLMNLAEMDGDFQALHLDYLVGDAECLERMRKVSALEPFSDLVVDFLDCVSKAIMKDSKAKQYPDVVTFGFWLRKASVLQMKNRFLKDDASVYRQGRGIAFHIAPSNVPVNYAYSLATGLLCGNANIVKIPSKDFEQMEVLNRAIEDVLHDFGGLKDYIVLVRYGHEKEINDALSSIADVRIIWGGDETIRQIRKSDLKPRATEITFADRYSLAVIDSDAYMEIEDKEKVARNFYNDTYLTDQNACTSPRLVAWLGSQIGEAKEIFWDELHRIVKSRYSIKGVQVVNKLTSAYLVAAKEDGISMEKSVDNLIVRMKVEKVGKDFMGYKDNSGYFFEADCKDVFDLSDFCNDLRCQTVAYVGDKKMLYPLVKERGMGIDRLVPVGKTMDFDLIWDGYDLVERMTRAVVLRG